MTLPLEAIAAEGAQLAAQAVPTPVGFLAGVWGRLTSPSPRDEITLSQDAFALLINGALDARTGKASTESHLGEGVMDCAYALMSGGGFGGTSPLGRLFRAVVGFFARLKSRVAPAQSRLPQSDSGEMRVG